MTFGYFWFYSEKSRIKPLDFRGNKFSTIFAKCLGNSTTGNLWIFPQFDRVSCKKNGSKREKDSLPVFLGILYPKLPSGKLT
jgi:hypothetical protein